jgi:NAD(P)-dependent dehydrogenase (short-subunit alcohol dehydrogenase family)
MLAAVGRLEGKVALITGAASGMGMVAAGLFADEGARVMLSDVADEAGETVAKEIEAAGHEAAYVHADVSSEADARAMVEATVERFGGLHVLYNNAGVMLAEDGSVDATDEAVWDRTLAINVKGVAHGCKHGIPAMIDSGGGSIVNVASFVAWMGAATSQTAYTASKGAVVAMTREIAVEYARRGIRAALRPGEASASVRAHPDGPARPCRGARRGRAVPGERRLLVHDGSLPDRGRRDHRGLRHARGLTTCSPPSRSAVPDRSCRCDGTSPSPSTSCSRSCWRSRSPGSA